MNNQNSSKQVLLSIIGIAILVVAVVGVSFAFFNYSKVGADNNTVTTGTIFFNFTEGTAITLENQFPLEDGQGQKLAEGDSGVLKFNVVGHNTAASDITYNIYAFKGADVDDSVHTTRLSNNDVKLYLSGTDAGSLSVNNFATPTVIGKVLGDQSKSDLTNDISTTLLIGTGTIAGNSDTNTTKSYELRMWISSDVQIVGEANQVSKVDKKGPEGYEATVYDEDTFGTMYYSLKLHLEANTPAVTD